MHEPIAYIPGLLFTVAFVWFACRDNIAAYRQWQIAQNVIRLARQIQQRQAAMKAALPTAPAEAPSVKAMKRMRRLMTSGKITFEDYCRELARIEPSVIG